MTVVDMERTEEGQNQDSEELISETEIAVMESGTESPSVPVSIKAILMIGAIMAVALIIGVVSSTFADSEDKTDLPTELLAENWRKFCGKWCGYHPASVPELKCCVTHPGDAYGVSGLTCLGSAAPGNNRMVLDSNCSAIKEAEALNTRTLQYKEMAKSCVGVASTARRLLQTATDPTEPPPALYKYIHRTTLGKNDTFAYYSNANLEEGGDYKIAVMMFHGATRDAFSYFCTGVDTIKGNGIYREGEVLVIAPDFGYGRDWINAVNAEELGYGGSALYWSHTLDYRAGARSSRRFPDGTVNTDPLSSFDVVDHLQRLLNNSKLFPNLEMVTLAGHSAGGQTVQRYALTTHLQPANYAGPSDMAMRKDIDVRYVVANPSSWAYLDERRWAYNCDNETKTCSDGELKVPTPGSGQFKTASPDGKFYTMLPDGEGVTADDGTPHVFYTEDNPKGDFFCWDPDYNKWHYGLGSGLADGNHDYLLQMNVTENINNYALRNVWYLAGEDDECSPAMPWYNETGHQGEDSKLQFSSACDFHHLDTRCPAMLEGPWRAYRAAHYLAYLYEYYGKTVHKMIQIAIQQDINVADNVGHSGLYMFISNEGKAAIYTPVDQDTISGW
jgi:pimeloyl-ACP methyl ester carboxylesterase